MRPLWCLQLSTLNACNNSWSNKHSCQGKNMLHDLSAVCTLSPAILISQLSCVFYFQVLHQLHSTMLSYTSVTSAFTHRLHFNTEEYFVAKQTILYMNPDSSWAVQVTLPRHHICCRTYCCPLCCLTQVVRLLFLERGACVMFALALYKSFSDFT